MTSNPNFNDTTTATEVGQMYAAQAKGKTVLITGVRPGSLGADTAYAIASGGPEKMILASRTKKNIDAVRDKIRSGYPSVIVEPLIVDLASQNSVRQAAAELNGKIAKLDILINNAGIMALPTRQLSPEGIEMQFATNHVGHFLFTNLVLDKLRKAAQGQTTSGATRVVMLTSNGHRFSPVRFHDWNFDKKPVPSEEEPGVQAMRNRGMPAPVFDGEGYEKSIAYGQSKTANILFARFLRNKLAGEGIQAITVHPGTIRTNLLRNFPSDAVENMIANGVVKFQTTDAGAATTVVAALDPQLGSLKDMEGLYLQDCQIGEPDPHATKWENAERLWTLSEELVHEKFPL